MSRDSFLDPSKFILDQVIDKLKEQFQTGTVTFPQLQRYIYEVLLNGFQNESFEFLADFFKSKVAPQKHKKSKWTKEDWLSKYEEIKGTDISGVKNEEVKRLANDLIGDSFLRSKEDLFLQALNTKEKVETPEKIYLPSMAGLVYFLYFCSIRTGEFDKGKLGSEQLMSLPEEVRLRELGWINDKLKSPKSYSSGNEEKNRKALEDFYNTYPPGEYNVIFLEEGCSQENPRFGISRWLINERSTALFFQHLTSKRVVPTQFIISDSSVINSFHLDELNPGWGYRVSVPRPYTKEGPNNFWIAYDGIREEEGTRLLGLGIAFRIFPGHERLLPVRMVETLEADKFRTCPDIEELAAIMDKKRETDEVPAYYQKVFADSERVSSRTVKRLIKLSHYLIEKGPPIEINDKDLIEID